MNRVIARLPESMGKLCLVRMGFHMRVLNCRPTGLAAFGLLGEPVGPLTTSRGRLGKSKR
jgi:hypothetical protein